jgi:sugar phosphate isomerase/epimerase
MNRIGIRAHDLGRLPALELAARIRAIGFDGLQLVPAKALDGPFSIEHSDSLAEAFSGLELMMLGAYFNPIHPDPAVVKEGIVQFKKMLQISGPLSALCVGTETGSLMGSPWGYVPRNHAPETLETVIRVFRELADYAGGTGGIVAIEGAWAHAAFSPEKIRAVLDGVGSPHLKVVLDLYNFLNPANHEDRMNLFERCLSAFGDDILIYHLKDYVVEDGVLRQVGLGQGLMDFPALIRRIKERTPDARLVFEGVTGDDIASSFQLISSLLRKEQRHDL